VNFDHDAFLYYRYRDTPMRTNRRCPYDGGTGSCRERETARAWIERKMASLNAGERLDPGRRAPGRRDDLGNEQSESRGKIRREVQTVVPGKVKAPFRLKKMRNTVCPCFDIFAFTLRGYRYIDTMILRSLPWK
jgi:hypothetical protein